MTALSQLIRWLQAKPVLPISVWLYWHEHLLLLPKEAVDKLSKADYPKTANCVLCGKEIAGPLDWWSLDNISGPCCTWKNGCRQIKSD